MTTRIDPARDPRNYVHSDHDDRWRPPTIRTRELIVLSLGFVVFFAVSLYGATGLPWFSAVAVGVAFGLAAIMLGRPVLTHLLKITPEDERGLSRSEFIEYRAEVEARRG